MTSWTNGITTWHSGENKILMRLSWKKAAPGGHPEVHGERFSGRGNQDNRADIDKLLPPISRFGGTGTRAKKKQGVIDKLKIFLKNILVLAVQHLLSSRDIT